MWFWRLHVGAEVKLRNCSIKKGCLTWRGYRTWGLSILTLEICFIDPVWHKGLSSIEVMAEIKLNLCFMSLQCENIPKVQGQAGCALPQKPFIKVTVPPH